MTVGYQVFNADGIEIINSNDPMLFVIANGSSPAKSWNDIISLVTFSYSGWPEPPIVLIRPRPGIYYGNFSLKYLSANSAGIFLDTGNQSSLSFPAFDWAVCTSSRSGLINPAARYGLEVYDENGKLTFSSSMRFARIIKIQSIKGPYSTTGSPINQSSALSGFSEMPWVMMRDAGTTLPFPANGDGAVSISFSFSINAALSLFSARLDDSVAPQYNQFQNGNMYFPLCLIPGL